jgi:hypothetical protein
MVAVQPEPWLRALITNNNTQKLTDVSMGVVSRVGKEDSMSFRNVDTVIATRRAT